MPRRPEPPPDEPKYDTFRPTSPPPPPKKLDRPPPLPPPNLAHQLSEYVDHLERKVKKQSALLGEIRATFSLERNREHFREHCPDLMPVADAWCERIKDLSDGK